MGQLNCESIMNYPDQIHFNAESIFVSVRVSLLRRIPSPRYGTGCSQVCIIFVTFLELFFFPQYLGLRTRQGEEPGSILSYF